jgi:hypothetical protein
MNANPLAHLQRKKPAKSYHEKYIQLPYESSSEPPRAPDVTEAVGLETVPSRKPVMIDKTNQPFDRKGVLEGLAKRGALTVRPSLREVPRQPFAVGVSDLNADADKDAEDIDPQVPQVLEIEPVAPSAAELPVAVPPGKKVAKKVPKTDDKAPKKAPKKPAARIEKWISDTEVAKNAPLNPRPLPQQPVVHRVSSYYLNNRKKFLTEINHLFAKYRAQLADKGKDISCQTQKEKGAIELMTHQKVITDYMNLYSPYRGLLLYHGLGSGKCHGINTPLIMYDGSVKKIQDVCVGEFLMGDDSTPRKVLSLARGRDVMYEIIPTDKTADEYTVNREHILCLKAVDYPRIVYQENHIIVQWIENNEFQFKRFTYHDEDNIYEAEYNARAFLDDVRKNPFSNENVVEIAVEDYLKLSDAKKGELKGYQTAVEFPEKALDIDAYFMGYWIGENICRVSEMTCRESGVVDYLNESLEGHRVSLKRQLQEGVDSSIYEVAGEGYDDFLAKMIELDVIKIKEIPMLYKCNSRANRLKLLAGILDSHGDYCNEKGCFELVYKIGLNNRCFMDGILFLVRSLGLGACYHLGKILIFGVNSEVPLLAPSFSLRRVVVGEHWSGETDIAVKQMESGEYYGFTLDGNGRYLLGDFTTTHNTCSSIALAEGMKSEKKIFVLTPASLKVNYFNELKYCGDQLYRIHQHWEFVSVDGQPDRVESLSESLQIPREIIEKQKGAWMMNPEKTANYEDLDSEERRSLDGQIDTMIHMKYEDIHYNGLNSKKIADLEDRGKRALPRGSKRKPNPFHDSVVVVDEAHNLVSRIHNQLKSVSGKGAAAKKGAEKGGAAAKVKIALKLYEWLMTAENARVILLSGTPIINYPSEIGVMFNILRGTIKTWTFQVKVETQSKVDKDAILNMFERAGLKTYDYVAYNRNELIITRNPFGFINKKQGAPVARPGPAPLGPAAPRAKTMKKGGEKKGRKTRGNRDKKAVGKVSDEGVIITPLPSQDKLPDVIMEKDTPDQNLHSGGGAVEDNYSGMERSGEILMSDEDFEKTVVEILNSNGLKVEKGAVRVQNHLLLPDNQDEFLARFVDIEDGSLKNEDALKRRILGLTSYFRSAQETLMPSFVLATEAGEVEPELEDVDLDAESGESESVESGESESTGETVEEEGKQMGGVITTNRIYHLVKTPLSSYQFGIYEKMRKEEATQEKNRRKRAKNQANAEGNVMENISSSYRIFSRVACNFVFPPPGRPMPPVEKEGKPDSGEGVVGKVGKKGGDDGDSQSPLPPGPENADEEVASEEGGARGLAVKSMRLISQMELGNEDGEMSDDDNELEPITEEPEDAAADEDGEPGAVKGDWKKAYQRSIQTALALLKNNGGKYLSMDALKSTYSPKMAAILERLQDPENNGLHLIYSQFRSLEGIQVMKLVLEQNGWAEFRIERGSEGWQIDWDVERHGEWKTNTKPCFVLYTGTETAETKEIIRNVYNGKWTVVPPSLVEQIQLKGEDNRNGEVIKIFMITSSGAEGISLANTRFVHIMEPYWNLVRLEQVIGRARRICSHEALPVSMRTVKVFLYLSVLSQEQSTSEKHIELRIRDLSRFDHKTPVTTDEYLLEIALLKDAINRQILTAIQSTAMDCSLYSESMNAFAKRSGEPPLVCYGFGKVTSNAFSMYPTLEEDLTKGETANVNERREKVAVVEFRYEGENYVKNMKNGEIYTRANYEDAQENDVDLVVVGKIVRDLEGKERVVLN